MNDKQATFLCGFFLGLACACSLLVAAYSFAGVYDHSRIVACVREASYTEEMTPHEYFARVDGCLAL